MIGGSPMSLECHVGRHEQALESQEHTNKESCESLRSQIKSHEESFYNQEEVTKSHKKGEESLQSHEGHGECDKESSSDSGDWRLEVEGFIKDTQYSGLPRGFPESWRKESIDIKEGLQVMDSQLSPSKSHESLRRGDQGYDHKDESLG